MRQGVVVGKMQGGLALNVAERKSVSLSLRELLMLPFSVRKVDLLRLTEYERAPVKVSETLRFRCRWYHHTEAAPGRMFS